jgi:hypothetical protein
MIIAYHYVWHSNYTWDSLGGYKIIIQICTMLGELGVNCFILISGYFMITAKNPCRFRKVILMWLQVLFYSILSAAVCAHYELIDFKEPGSTFPVFLPLTFKVWWYATAYILLYLFSPYLNRLLHNLTQKEYVRFLALSFLLYSIIPTFAGLLNNNSEVYLYYNRFIWLIILYCFAGYIRLYGFSLPVIRNHWFMVHVMTWALLIFYMLTFDQKSMPEYIKATDVYFYAPNTILLLFLSVSLFMVFQSIHIKGNKVITFIASCTFGIYLVHDGRSRQFWWNNIFHNPAYEGTTKVFLDMFIAIVTIFSVGFAIECVRKAVEHFIIEPILNLGENFINTKRNKCRT